VVRRDAEVWNEILRTIPGFYPEGSEYRRPHWYTIWKWSPERAREMERATRRGGPRDRRFGARGAPRRR
jgi:hypothetical protein